MKVATWNVNSVRSRLDRVVAWLAANQPDALCLQETKTEDKTFPFEALQAAGYHIAHHGQKTYNGVAILSKTPAEDVVRGFGDDEDDPQSRFIAGTVGGVRILSAYIPNGSELDSPKYQYKLRWLARLRQHLDRHYTKDRPLLLCGDFNVAPDERDVHDPGKWERTVLFSPDIRAALAEVAKFGLVDTFRLHHQDGGKFSWWDYRMLAFPRNEGLRIDHVFATAPIADRCKAASIDREERKGKQASDHAPVVVEIDLPSAA